MSGMSNTAFRSSSLIPLCVSSNDMTRFPKALTVHASRASPSFANIVLASYLPSESSTQIDSIAGCVLLQPGRSGPKGNRSVRATATWGPGGGRGFWGCGGWGPGLLRRLMTQQPILLLLLLLPGAGPRIKRPVYGLRVDSHHCWVRLLCPCPSSLKIVGWSSDVMRVLLHLPLWLALSLSSAARADCAAGITKGVSAGMSGSDASDAESVTRQAFGVGEAWSERLPGLVQPLGCMTVRRLPVHLTPEGSFRPATRLGVINARRLAVCRTDFQEPSVASKWASPIRSSGQIW